MELLIVCISVIILGEVTYLVLQHKPIRRHSEIILDTSILIDGRIVSVARSGLLTATLAVPQSVLRELQYMADKADADKRARARYGLDVVSSLKELEGVTVTIIDDGLPGEGGVDERLLELAKQRRSRLCTTDYNLNKVARAESVYVVNINELAHALRVTYLPGETLNVNLQQPGQGSHQAVGYLDDGTMVVVEQARKLIGQEVETEVIRSLQTEAGRMLFARLASYPAPPATSAATKADKKPKRYTSRRTPEDSFVDLANKDK